MKKIELIKKSLISLVVIGMLVGVFLPLVVFARSTTPPTIITDVEGIRDFLKSAANVLYIILGGIAVFMFIWAGITFVTAEGDSTKVQNARNRVLYGVVGLAVALLAAGLIYLVESILRM